MIEVPTLTPKKKPAPSLSKELLPVWSSTGVREKPEGCRLCPFRTKGAGFVPDWWPDQDGEAPKIGFLLDFPGSDDVLEYRPWAGRAGYAWEKTYLAPFGLSRSNVFIGHVLRCQPKDRQWGKPVYPTARLKQGAEITCRRHDKVCWGGPVIREGGLHTLNPNIFIVTFHPREALAVAAFSRLILNDIGRAVKFMKEGYRPLVLLGDEPKNLIAPWLKNSVKTWRGTYWRGVYPFLETSALLEPGFLEV